MYFVLSGVTNIPANPMVSPHHEGGRDADPRGSEKAINCGGCQNAKICFRFWFYDDECFLFFILMSFSKCSFRRI